MKNLGFLGLLALAALLEAGGDALMRGGLRAASPGPRAGFLLAGAAVLFLYGIAVNLPPWNFGRLLGVYVALFFVSAQTINLFAFGTKPSLPICCGGMLILSGGLLITFWQG